MRGLTVTILSLSLLIGCNALESDILDEGFEEVDSWQSQGTDGVWRDAREYFEPEYNPFSSDEPIEIWRELHGDVEYLADEDNEWRYAHETYEGREGDCEDQAILLCSALLAEGYDAWVVIGRTWTTDDNSLHAWVLLRKDDKTYYFNETAYPWFFWAGIEAYNQLFRPGWKVYMAVNDEKILVKPGEWD